MSNIQQGINQLFDIGAIATGRWEQSIRESTPEAPAGYTPDPRNKGVIGAKREKARIEAYNAKALPAPAETQPAFPEPTGPQDSDVIYLDESHWVDNTKAKIRDSLEQHYRNKAMKHMANTGLSKVDTRESVRRLLLKQRGAQVQKLLDKEEKHG